MPLYSDACMHAPTIQNSQKQEKKKNKQWNEMHSLGNANSKISYILFMALFRCTNSIWDFVGKQP